LDFCPSVTNIRDYYAGEVQKQFAWTEDGVFPLKEIMAYRHIHVSIFRKKIGDNIDKNTTICQPAIHLRTMGRINIPKNDIHFINLEM